MAETPPEAAYDYEQLAAQIASLARSGELEKQFYSPVGTPGAPLSPRLCQGDVLEFAAPVPVIDENGEAVALEEANHWLLISNTCDLERSLTEVAWGQVVPIVTVGNADASVIDALRCYMPSRRFLIPPWDQATEGRVMFADLVMPVTAHKQHLLGARVVGRLQRHAWVLLHCCLVRFLARGESRFDLGLA